VACFTALSDWSEQIHSVLKKAKAERGLALRERQTDSLMETRGL